LSIVTQRELMPFVLGHPSEPIQVQPQILS
jgi:hypothetical protein